MKNIIVAGMLGLMAASGLQTAAHSAPLWAQPAPVKAGESRLPIVRVQSGDALMQVQQLQEEIRSLNGRIEEMSYQLLQMQEQIRKTQEDNEFRFQDLERKGGNKKSGSLETPAQQPATDDVARIIEEPGVSSGSDQSAASADTGGSQTGKPAMELGSIELDANGNPVGATIKSNGDNASAPLNDNTSAGTDVAALGSEGEVYQAAYGHVLSGDYAIAEKEFQDYISRYPSGAKAADANFWLGEALYSQGKYSDAAKTFLNAHQTYGKSPKAPEMLLKLGMSLAALDNKDTACATLREVPKRYPKASKAVVNKVAAEQKRLSC